jgi:uncharacterized protein (DUF362 family)
MTDVRETALPDLDAEAIDGGLEALLGDRPARLERADRVLLLPDTHYPHHPSTGLVTNPAVVGALARLLDTTVGIGVPDGARIDANRVGRYLGYEAVAARTGAEIVDLGAASRVERRVRFVDGTRSIAVPEPLHQDTLLVVPTARRDRRFGVAAGLVTLGHAVTTEPTRADLLAAVRLCWPALGVLDATFTYPDEPRRSGILAAGDDLVTLSRRAAQVVDVDPADVSHLQPRRSPPSPRGALAGRRTSDSDTDGDGLLDRGYRAYARLTGDLLPPQMLPRGDGE